MTDSERNQQSTPADPAGIEAPHDVLAAEEFAMPAGAEPHPGSPAAAGQAGDGGGPGARAYLPLALAALILLLVLRRRR